jgi:hypothetical protein
MRQMKELPWQNVESILHVSFCQSRRRRSREFIEAYEFEVLFIDLILRLQ